MSAKTNKLGATLLLKVLQGELTAEEAKAQMESTKKFSVCKVGRFGMCLTHGQPISECKEEIK